MATKDFFMSFLSGVTDYAFNSRFNYSDTYTSTAFNRQFDERLSDFLNSSFPSLSTDEQVVCLKAFMVKYLS